ncbi:MAG TPA: DUF4386 domain-containing protein [Gammaproteobacteria bacterium]|nr:DUF4386 domain-containing protein [Gammaproteobacteria bacterium]
MTTLSKNARIVGLFYLLLVFAGPIRLIYVPTKLFVHGDAAATAANILAHETLFRLGIGADLVGAVIIVFLTLAFYRFFKDVDHYQAVLLVIVGGVMPSTLYFVNTLNDAAALSLIQGADYLTVFTEPQRYALARFFLDLHYHLIVSSEVLWGLWLFPMAILTIKSNFLPKFLGWWLILNGIAYLVLSFTGVFYPQYEDTIDNYAFPFQLGEVAFVLWVLIMGAKERKT